LPKFFVDRPTFKNLLLSFFVAHTLTLKQQTSNMNPPESASYLHHSRNIELESMFGDEPHDH
jgi:hypothetical protein